MSHKNFHIEGIHVSFNQWSNILVVCKNIKCIINQKRLIYRENYEFGDTV